MIQFRMLEADAARLHGVSTSRLAANGIWKLPIGAQSQSKQQQARLQRLDGFYNTTFQTHGLSAPNFTLEATFGTKDKDIGGTVYTPRELIQDLETFIGYYFTTRQTLMRNREPAILMAFDDFVNGDHWLIVPEGMPNIRNHAREPLRPSFSISFSGVVKLEDSSKKQTFDTIPRDLSPKTQAGIKKQLEPYVLVS